MLLQKVKEKWLSACGATPMVQSRDLKKQN